MKPTFSDDVQSIVGPVLTKLGFTLVGIDENSDSERGGSRHIVYYRSDDCKIQVYESSREGEVNCMIAPLDALDDFGLRTKKWQYITRFAKRPDGPLEDLVRSARIEYESYENPLEWVRDRIIRNYDMAHAGILEMYGRA